MKSKKTRFSEFIGLKSKIYSLVDVDDDESKKGKEVNGELGAQDIKNLKKINFTSYLSIS